MPARPRRWWPSTGSGSSATSSGTRSSASVVDTEIGWAKANCLTPDSYAEARATRGPPGGVAVDQVAEAFAAYEASLRRRRHCSTSTTS